ncbi:MAG: hypothetical protein ACRYFX_07330 [Janthinobacterium lividum]
MATTDPLTQKRRDVRHLHDELTQLEQQLQQLEQGPGYYEASQELKQRVEAARQTHHRAQTELTALQAGTQGAIF